MLVLCALFIFVFITNMEVCKTIAVTLQTQIHITYHAFVPQFTTTTNTPTRMACLPSTISGRCFAVHFLTDRSGTAIILRHFLLDCYSICCCLPTPMTLASGGSPMFPLVVHQPASPSIWSAVQSLRRGLSTNPGATMWCVCGCS